MQTGMDERGRRIVLDALVAEGALKGTSGPATSGEGEEFVRHKSALAGMRMALPLALWLWALIAALIWAWRR
jgi:hypothetical protein